MTAAMISYSYATTPNNQVATTIKVTPPPVYAAGNLLVMTVMAGKYSTSNGGAPVTTPSGWTARSASGAPFSVFTKTATGSEPATYTVTLGGYSCAAAVFVAAYPAATVAKTSFQASPASSTAWSPTFPTGVTSGQTVLLCGGAVASATDATGNAGWQNYNQPAGWTSEVPVFGPALENYGTNPPPPPVVGLADIQGSTSNPELTTPQGANLYAGFLVLTITGTAPAPLQVTATNTSPATDQPGVTLTVRALTGAATPDAIAAGGATATWYADGISAAPAATVTPAASGSKLFGAVTETVFVDTVEQFTAESGTSFSQNIADGTGDAIYGTLEGSGTTTAGTPVTLGGTGPANEYTTAAIAEILAAPGQTITEVATALASATTSGQYATTAIAQTATFGAVPPAGALLVAMISANSDYPGGNATFEVTSTPGLTWVKLAEIQYPSYSGVWVAQIPGGTVTGAGTAGIAAPGAGAAGAPVLAASGGAGLAAAGVSGTALPPPPRGGSFVPGAAIPGLATPGSGGEGGITATGTAGLAAAGTAGAGSTPAVTATGTAGLGAPAAAGAYIPPLVFPQAPLDVGVDVELDGWTDITTYALQREGTSAPISITRGRPDEASQVNPSSMTLQLNNRDGRFSVKNPAGPWYGTLTRNTPIRVSVPAQSSYLRLEEDYTSACACPDSAALRISGDIDIRADVHITGVTNSTIASKYDNVAGHGGWTFYLYNDCTLGFSWSADGTTYTVVASTIPIPMGRQCLRVTLDVNNGTGGSTVTFWTGPAGGADGTTWTQLGDPVISAGTTSISSAGPRLTVGDWDPAAGVAATLNGSYFEFELRSGIGGTVAAHAVFSALAPGVTGFTDAQGNPWTLYGTAEISGRDYRFHGEMSSLPVAWDTTGRDVWVPVTAGGLLRRLGQGNAPLDSALKRALLSQTGTLAPVAYWPCEDLQGSVSIGSAVGGQLMAVFGGTGDGSVTNKGPAFAADDSFLCSMALPTVNGSTWVGYVPGYESNGSIVVRFLMDLTGAPGSGVRIMRVITTGTCTEFTLYFTIIGGANCLGLAAYNSAGTVFDSGGYAFPGLVGTQFWVSMELRPGTGGTINWSLETLQPGSSTGEGISGSVPGTIGNATAVYTDPYADLTDATIGHISVQSDWQSLFDLYQPLDAWQGELAAARFLRLCAENGIVSRIYGPPGTTVAMGAQSPETLTELLQECEDADHGMIYEPRQILALGYRPQASLLNQAPAVTIDYAATQLGGNGGEDQVQPTYDDQYTRNDETITRGSGEVSGANYRYQLDDGSPMSISPPPDGVGDYADSQTINVLADSQLPDQAGWLVHLGTVDEARWPSLPINMARPAVAAIYWQVQAADIGDYVAITDPPAWLPPDEIRQLIPGTKEDLGGFFYAIDWNAVPESPYETIILDDPVYGRVDTDGSGLQADVGLDDTSFQVATTDATTPIWTTDPADCPFDIAIGGERMTVTAVSGEVSPQAMTVTRSVNGVVKTHSAGDDVRLWFPPILAML